MKSYNSIPHWNKGKFGSTVVAFDKLDGSNLRFEWSPKRGWYKFGSRNVMITSETKILGEGIQLFLNKYSDGIEQIIRTNKNYRNIRSVVTFVEFFGENSFAGQHEDEDKKDVMLIDINLYQKGLIHPKPFIDDFGHLGIPNIVYKGEYTQEFIDHVKENKFNLQEGVVCKGVVDKKLWMTKIKTWDWLDRVKEKMGIKYVEEDFNGDQSLLDEFNTK